MEEPLPTVPAPGPGQPPGPPDWSRVQAPGPVKPSSFGVGTLLSRSFRIWGRHVLAFAVVGALGSLPIALMMYWLYSRMPTLMAMDPARPQEFLAELTKNIGATVLGWLVAMLAMALQMAAVCRGADQALHGERIRLGAMLGAAVHRGPYVLALFLLASLAWLATICTLVVPVLLVVAWCVSIPATVVEGVGPVQALGRSWGLTRGYRWHLFAGFVVLTLCVAGASMIIQSIWMAVQTAVSGPPLVMDPFEAMRAMALPIAIQQVVAGMLGTLTPVGMAVAHHALRSAKEGGDPVALAQVFE